MGRWPKALTVGSGAELREGQRDTPPPRCNSTQNPGIPAAGTHLHSIWTIPWRGAEQTFQTEGIPAEHSSREPGSFSRSGEQPFWDLPLSYYLNGSQKMLIMVDNICFSLSLTLSIDLIVPVLIPGKGTENEDNYSQAELEKPRRQDAAGERAWQGLASWKGEGGLPALQAPILPLSYPSGW